MIDALFEALGWHPDVNVIKLIALSYELYDDQLLVSDARYAPPDTWSNRRPPKNQGFRR